MNNGGGYVTLDALLLTLNERYIILSYNIINLILLYEMYIKYSEYMLKTLRLVGDVKEPNFDAKGDIDQRDEDYKPMYEIFK